MLRLEQMSADGNHSIRYVCVMGNSSLQNDAAKDRHDKALAKVSGLVDRQLSPLGLQAIKVLDPRPGETVLDLGCGAGQTLLQIAELVGANGSVIGVDISNVLLSIARERCASDPRIELIEADAQTLCLPKASLDCIFSRFGVMGFANPSVAFDNFRSLLKSGGRLAFCCWRTLEENELDRIPIEAAGRKNEVRAKPFSFADPSYVRKLLEGAGFESVVFEAYNERVSCGSLNETVEVLLSVGALGQIVREKPTIRSEVEPLLREALLARGVSATVELTAAVWIVSALAVDPQPVAAGTV